MTNDLHSSCCSVTRRLFSQVLIASPFIIGGGSALTSTANSSNASFTPLCAFSYGSASIPKFSSGEISPLLVRTLQGAATAFSIKPKVRLLDDQGNPALRLWRDNTNGEIFIGVGKTLIESIEGDENSEEIAFGLLAHEFSHVLQLNGNCPINVAGDRSGVPSVDDNRTCVESLVGNLGTVKYLELHADFISGWALAKQGLLTTSTFSGFVKHLFEKGDRLFKDPDHHGTPQERIQSLSAGYMFGKEGDLKSYYTGQTVEFLKYTPDSNKLESAFLMGQIYLYTEL